MQNHTDVRSHRVRTEDGKQYRRNRKQLRATQNMPTKITKTMLSGVPGIHMSNINKDQTQQREEPIDNRHSYKIQKLRQERQTRQNKWKYRVTLTKTETKTFKVRAILTLKVEGWLGNQLT